jgi:hypothetical protein
MFILELTPMQHVLSSVACIYFALFGVAAWHLSMDASARHIPEVGLGTP